MNFSESLPGNSRHQAALRAIVEYYRDDPRILAVIVFGSLGRGNWDQFSDLDMDFILADPIQLNVLQELRELCTALQKVGEHPALILPDGDDAGDVVFASLLQMSARYHRLGSTSPAILDSMRILSGPLSAEEVIAAGSANRWEEPPLEQLVDCCLRYAAVADVYLQRGRIWGTTELLHRMRSLFLELYGRTQGGGRGFLTFEEAAPKTLQARLENTLAQASPDSLRQALLCLIDLLENDLDLLTAGQACLSPGQKAVLKAVKQNQGG
jgi:predicted nucleotidyltransferase